MGIQDLSRPAGPREPVVTCVTSLARLFPGAFFFLTWTCRRQETCLGNVFGNMFRFSDAGPHTQYRGWHSSRPSPDVLTSQVAPGPLNVNSVVQVPCSPPTRSQTRVDLISFTTSSSLQLPCLSLIRFTRYLFLWINHHHTRLGPL